MSGRPAGGAAGEKKRFSGSLAARVLAGAVFLPIFVLVAREGGWYYFALVESIIVVGLIEYFGMTSRGGARPDPRVGLVFGAALPFALFVRGGEFAPLLVSALLITAATAELAHGRRENALARIAVTVYGVFYVSWLGSHLVLLRELPGGAGLEYSAGFSLVAAVFAVTWGYDTGAYAAGKLFGRRKLFPSISPGKTAEGSAGGLVFSIASILTLRVFVDLPVTAAQAVVLATVGSIVGQAGDLAESLIKRDTGVKDSSHIIPGHGGVLDRFDSLLFTAPALYYLFRHVILG